MEDYSNLSVEEIDRRIADIDRQIAVETERSNAGAQSVSPMQQAAPQIGAKPVEEMTLDEINARIAQVNAEIAQIDGGEQMQQSVPRVEPRRRLTSEEKIARNNAAIARAMEYNGETDNIDPLAEGAKGAGRALKDIGKGFVGIGSSVVRLAGTPIRALTGWDGLHKLADGIDHSYDNFGAGVLESEFGKDADGGFAVGRFGEKMAGIAGSLAALGGAGKAIRIAGGLTKAGAAANEAVAMAARLNAAGKAAEAAEVMSSLGRGAKAANAVMGNALPALFGNDAAVRTYDTAQAAAERNGEEFNKARALGLASVNGAIHFFGFKAFENQSLNKMLGMPQAMEAAMPGWAKAAQNTASGSGQTFSGIVNGVRKGMAKYILAERAKGALKAGGIMGLQDFLSSIPTQMAEGASLEDVDLMRAVSEGGHGVVEGALMEGLMGGAALLKTPKAAKKFVADRFYRKGYDVVKPDGGTEHIPGLPDSTEGREFLMKQNPEATRRILDIVSHGGKVRPEELDAACLPTDMTERELKKFERDWGADLGIEETRGEEGEFLGDGEEMEGVENGPQREGERRVQAQADRDAEEMGARLEKQGQEMRQNAEEQDEYNRMMEAREEARAQDRAEGAVEPAGARGGAETGNEPSEVPERAEGSESAPAVEPPAHDNRLLRPQPNFRQTGDSTARPEPEQEPEQERPNETGNVPDEAAAEPEQRAEQPADGKAARSVEGADAGAEAPREGVVDEPAAEVSKSDGGGQKLTGWAAEVGEPARKPPKLRTRAEADAANAQAVQTEQTAQETVQEAETPAQAAQSVQTTAQEPVQAVQKPLKLRTKAEADVEKAQRKADAQAAKAQAEADAAEKKRQHEENIRGNRVRKAVDKLKKNNMEPSQLSLKELKELYNDNEWHMTLGADDAAANDLRGNVRAEYERRYLGDKRGGKYVSAVTALDWLERKPDSLDAIAKAQSALSGAYERAKSGGDELGERLLADRIRFINERISSLPQSQQAKIAEKIRLNAAALSPMERKNRVSNTTAEGDEIDVTTTGKEDAEEPADEYGEGARFGRIAESADSKAGGQSAPRGATGQGGSLKGNRHIRIDSVEGDKITATMVDAAGKTIAANVPMNREQWKTFANASRDAGEVDPENPQKGDMIRMSNVPADSLPQGVPAKWTAAARKPLERVAHVLRNAVTVGGKRVKVLFVPRPKNVDGGTRKSIGGIYTGSAADYANESRQGGKGDGPSLQKIGTGEGSQVYGLGLYGSTVRGVAEYYANRRNLIEDLADAVLEKASGSNEIALDDLRADKRLPREDRFLKMSDEEIDIVEKYIKGEDISKYETGSLYEQTFFTDRAPGDESHLLKWYDAISDANWDRVIAQAEKEGLRDKLKGAWWLHFNGDLEHFITDNGNSGDAIYERLSKLLGSPQAASEFLARAGIDGVKYPVDSYGGKGVKDGDVAGWNYVSFRDDNIRVDHKWTDGKMRYMKNADGVTVGEYDAAKGEIRLYPGATVADVVHEFTHPLVDYARAEAKAGRSELLNKIRDIIEAERKTWDKPVRDAYKGKGEEEILEEIFTHAMGDKGAKLFGKSTTTLEGRRWYNRLWEAIKGVWRDFATKMGWNKADLSGLEKMTPEEAAQKILGEMAKGRNFGDAVKGGGETRNALMPNTMQRIYDSIIRYKNAGMKFTPFTESIITMLGRGGTKEIELPGYEITRLIIDNPALPQVTTHKSTMDHSAFNHNWENGNAYAGYYTWPEFDRAFRDYNLKGIQKLPNKTHDGQEIWQWKVKYPKTDAHDAYELTWKIIREENTGKMVNLYTSRGETEYPPAQIKSPEGEHLDTITSRDVADSSSSGEQTRNVPQPDAEVNGGEEEKSKVRASRRVAAPGTAIMDEDVTIGEKAREKLDDSRIILRGVQGEIGYAKDGVKDGIEEVMDPNTDFVDWRKSSDVDQAADKANGFEQKHEKVLQSRKDEINRELVKMDGLSRDKAEELANRYLIALHAKERNKTIAERNGDTNDPNYLKGDYAKGAAISDNEAAAILASPEVRKYRTQLERIADIKREVAREDLRLRLENGLLSQEQYDFYANKWKDYVPLRTDVESDSKEAGVFNTSTATIGRSEYRTAHGRGEGNIADSPLAFLFAQAQDGIRKSAHNVIGNVAANMVRKGEARGLNSIQVKKNDGSTATEYRIAEIVPVTKKSAGARYEAVFSDGSTAEIGSDMRLASNQKNIVPFKRPELVKDKDGKKHMESRLYLIRFNRGEHGRGLRVAKAINGTNMAEVPDWVKPFSAATRFLSKMNTSMSPSFLVSNLFNDRNEGWRTLMARHGVKDGTVLAGTMMKAIHEGRKDVRAWVNDSVESGDFKRFADGGGLIKGGTIAHGYSGELESLRDSYAKCKRDAVTWGDRLKDPSKLLRPDTVTKLMSDAFGIVQASNEAAEIGTRYGIYKVVRDHLVKNGVSDATAHGEAIRFAREATTNFNRRGTLAPIIGSFYMFYNANVQGAKRNLQSLADKHGVQTFATLATVAAATTALRFWLGNDDDREKAGGRNAKNAMEHSKQMAMGIPLPGAVEFTGLKMRGIDSLIPYAATKFTEAMLRNDVSMLDALGDTLRAAAGEVFGVLGGNGVGNKSQMAQTLAPSVADPVIQWATGTDWLGEQRVRQQFNKNNPKSWNGKAQTSGVFKWIAQTVNAMSGGNKLRPGKLDMAPEDVQLIAETIFGGLGRDATGAINTYTNVKEIAKGGGSDRLFSKMPVVKSILREYPESTGRYIEAVDAYNADKNEYKQTTDLKRRAKLKREHPYLTSGKSLLDGMIEQVKTYSHLERGEVKHGQKWVEPKVQRTEAQKEMYRKKRLALQARILKRLGE